MTKPEVVRCYDGHFRRAVYGLGPYIADYQEQILVMCVVQGWCATYVPNLLNCMFPIDVCPQGVCQKHQT